MTIGSADILLWTSSGVVIVGVALEELGLFRDTKKFWRELRLSGWSAAISKVRAKGTLVILEKAGFVLLIAGLAGELLFQAKVEVRDAQELGAANINAAHAMTQAAALGVSMDNLDKYVKTRVMRAGQDITDLKAIEDRFNAALNAANERAARIESRLSPREIDDAKQLDLVEALRPLAGTAVDIWVMGNGDEQESINLGEVFFRALSTAQWKPSLTAGYNGTGAGIGVAVMDADTKLQNAAEALATAVGHVGLGPIPPVIKLNGSSGGFITMIHERAGPSAPIKLVIGPKPE
jgi:hypothetical protein